MKTNIFLSLAAAGTLIASFTSCSMDNEPVGSLLEEDALQTVNDCYRFRNGFYNNVRSTATGAYVAYTELQMDMFVGTKINGNNQGPLNNGDINSSDRDIESIWSGLYYVIANTNYFFGKIDEVMAHTSGDQLVELKRYRAEAHFVRAYFYYWLLDHYCPRYTAANERYGLPLVSEYGPSSEKDTYPGRSTQSQTYAFIEYDLNEALQGLLEYETIDPSIIQANSPYISSWAVKCLQARLALLKGDYPKAKTISEEIITANVFPLTTMGNYPDLWVDDRGSEVVFRPIATPSELGIASTGIYWNNASELQSNYLPVAYACQYGTDNLYDNRRDIRYRLFMNNTRDLLYEGSQLKCPIFSKYMGNTALRTVATVNNMMNMPKVFRTSEQYLIAAEACYETGDAVGANKWLNDLRSKRLPSYTAQTYAGTQLRDEIRLERTRELIGEGFRMSDLRRWGLGFTRIADDYTTCPEANDIVTVAGNHVTYQPNDYRFTWPIPSSEIQVNPQMAGQQNPGY